MCEEAVLYIILLVKPINNSKNSVIKLKHNGYKTVKNFVTFFTSIELLIMVVILSLTYYCRMSQIYLKTPTSFLNQRGL